MPSAVANGSTWPNAFDPEALGASTAMTTAGVQPRTAAIVRWGRRGRTAQMRESTWN
jgi:hypothetical protein